MSIAYVLAPLLAWVISGSLKFLINFIKYGDNAFNHIGNGGFPSTHTTIVSTMGMLIGCSEGFDTPIFGLSFTFLIITVIDATGIRKALGNHAIILNNYLETQSFSEKKLREKQGHTKIEIFGGLLLGCLIGFLISLLV